MSTNRPGMHVLAWDGLGDNIYLRPFVRALSEIRPVWVRTPWPEVYADLPVKFSPTESSFRTQRKNLARQPAGRWSVPPPGIQSLAPYLHNRDQTSIGECIRRSLPVPSNRRYPLELPPYPRPASAPVGPYAVLRPCVVREEWINETRNPRPEYLVEAAELAAARGLARVSVADLEAGREWIERPEPAAEYVFHRGELPVEELFGLIRFAELVITPVGWSMLAALAYGTPCLVIGGGRGQYENPVRLLDPWTDTSRFRWIVPDAFCPCGHAVHDCDKRISDFGERAELILEELLG